MSVRGVHRCANLDRLLLCAQHRSSAEQSLASSQRTRKKPSTSSGAGAVCGMHAHRLLFGSQSQSCVDASHRLSPQEIVLIVEPGAPVRGRVGCSDGGALSSVAPVGPGSTTADGAAMELAPADAASTCGLGRGGSLTTDCEHATARIDAAGIAALAATRR